jgi:hypothetical protein
MLPSTHFVLIKDGLIEWYLESSMLFTIAFQGIRRF